MASVRCNLLGVFLKKKKKKSRWFLFPRLSFGGIQCAGIFLSRSPKSGKKVFIDLLCFTQNVFIEHLLYASTGSTPPW